MILENQTVRITELPGVEEAADYGNALTGFRFNNCLLLGPVILFPRGDKVFFINSTINAPEGDREAILWELDEYRRTGVVGVIAIEDSVFYHCVFRHVGFVADKRGLNQFREIAQGPNPLEDK